MSKERETDLTMEGIIMGVAGEEGEMKCKMERQTKERARNP